MAASSNSELSGATRFLVHSAERAKRAEGPLPAALGCVAVGIVTLADLVSGPHFSLLAGYAAVVLAAGWKTNRPVVATLALLSAIGTGLAAGLDPDEGAAVSIIAINAGLRAALLLVVGGGAWLLREALRELSTVARHDPLTGLFNRAAVFEIGEHERARALRSERPLTVAYFDLDGLKTINDTAGHDAGDDLIRRFAHALERGLRTSDAVARLGGDEFVAVLPETDEAAASAALRRILDDPDTPSASCGVVTWTIPTPPIAELVIAADELMYEAKHDGGGLRARTVADRPATFDRPVPAPQPPASPQG